jgi:hypothetical protein
MVVAALQRGENESTCYDYISVGDGVVSMHWQTIVLALARVPLRFPDRRTDHAMPGRRQPRLRRSYAFDTRLPWNVLWRSSNN